MISLNDMLATLAALTGEKWPPGIGPDSFDILPALLRQESQAPLCSSLVMTARGTGEVVVRKGKWKFIDGQGSVGYAHNREREKKPALGDPEGQLCDLENDIGESKDLYGRHPEIVQRLRGLLRMVKGEGASPPQRVGFSLLGQIERRYPSNDSRCVG